ncbi:MAG: hypothetical protein AB4426_14025 [Xenococcaceae cyanobacterium]
MTDYNLKDEQRDLIKKLEARLNSLENSLKQLNNPSDRAVKVTGALDVPKIKRIKISKEKLVEIYNEVSQILSEYAIKVSLTAESYRQITQDKIFLEKTARGNYYIVATEEKEQDKYWLLLNENITINIHRIKTLQFLFKLEGEQSSNPSEFTLKEPAIVSIMPSGQQWKLEKQGILYVGKISPSSKLPLELEQINKERKQFQSQLEALTLKISELQSKLEQQNEKRKQDNISWLTEHYNFKRQIEEAEEERKQLHSLLEKANQERRQMRSQIEKLFKRLIQSQAELVAVYNQNPDLLSGQVTVVSKIEYNMNKRPIDISEPAIFEKNIKGIYWILTVEKSSYMVYKKSKIKINQYNFKTVQSMFECRGYQPGKDHDFKLLKPARVSPIDGGEKWELVERGVLEFDNTPVIDVLIEPSATSVENSEIDPQSESEEIQAELVEDSTSDTEQLTVVQAIWQPTPAHWQNVQLLHTLTDHTNSVRCLAISDWQQQSDKQILASGSFDDTIKIWNLNTGQLISTLTRASRVNAIAISPDGQTLISSGNNNTIKIWNIVTATQNTLSGHSDWILCLAISPDGQTLVSGSSDRTIKIWNLQTGEIRHTLTGDDGAVLAIAISPDGRTLVSSSGTTIRLWNLATGKLLPTLLRHSDLVWSVAISPNGQTLASGSRDKTIKLWNLNTGKLEHTLTEHSGEVWSVAISPDGQTLVSGSGDKTIKLWNLNTGELLCTLKDHSQEVYSVAFSPDEQTLVSAGRDQTIKIWKPSLL